MIHIVAEQDLVFPWLALQLWPQPFYTGPKNFQVFVDDGALKKPFLIGQRGRRGKASMLIPVGLYNLLIAAEQGEGAAEDVETEVDAFIITLPISSVR